MRTTTPRATTRAMNAADDPLISGISVAPLTVCCCGHEGLRSSPLADKLKLTGCGGRSLNGTGVSCARKKGIVSVREDVVSFVSSRKGRGGIQVGRRCTTSCVRRRAG